MYDTLKHNKWHKLTVVVNVSGCLWVCVLTSIASMAFKCIEAVWVMLRLSVELAKGYK